MAEDSVKMLVYFGLFVVSGSFHEAAHAWSAWRLGDPTAKEAGRMTLNPLVHLDLVGTVLFPLINMLAGTAFLIGWMRPVPVIYQNLARPRSQILFISLAGPFANLLLCLFAALGLSVLLEMELLASESGMAASAVEVLCYFGMINLMLALFNLMPVPPLDGSSLVDFIRRDPYGTYHSKGQIGIILLYALFLSGGLSVIWSGAIAVMEFLIKSPVTTAALLAGFLGMLILFARKTALPGESKRAHRASLEHSKDRSSARGRKLGEALEKARRIQAAQIHGETVPSADRQWIEGLRADEGDGRPLCAPISFGVENAFCQECRNVLRCILRESGDGATDRAPGIRAGRDRPGR